MQTHRPKPKDKFVHVRVDEQTFTLLNKHAVPSVSELLRKLINNFLKTKALK